MKVVDSFSDSLPKGCLSPECIALGSCYNAPHCIDSSHRLVKHSVQIQKGEKKNLESYITCGSTVSPTAYRIQSLVFRNRNPLGIQFALHHF